MKYHQHFFEPCNRGAYVVGSPRWTSHNPTHDVPMDFPRLQCDVPICPMGRFGRSMVSVSHGTSNMSNWTPNVSHGTFIGRPTCNQCEKSVTAAIATLQQKGSTVCIGQVELPAPRTTTYYAELATTYKPLVLAEPRFSFCLCGVPPPRISC